MNTTCACGQSYEAPEKKPPDFLSFLDRPECCPACTVRQDAEDDEADRRMEAEQREKQAARNEAAVDRIIPPRLRLTDPADARFNSVLWDQVTAWQPTAEKPWLGLVGETGESKTRCAYLRLRQFAREAALAERPFHGAMISGMEFARAVVEQYREEGSGKVLREARTAGILVFDELGKVKATAGVMDELFALIDHRHAHNLVTIWTGNAGPQEFCTAWPEEYAGPGCGRILEASVVVG
ncbi:hypothetical protein [Luteolibacter sp. Populi]|uniref:hypothetical protein n=1 Tax=Luteolibacter sp. Populi TaxID=3230487 RepID=UPI003465467A